MNFLLFAGGWLVAVAGWMILFRPEPTFGIFIGGMAIGMGTWLMTKSTAEN